MKTAKFYLRKQGKNDPIITFILHDGRFEHRKVVYSTGHHIQPDRWSKKQERAKDNRALNNFLDFIEEISKAFLLERLDSKTLSRQDFRNYITSRLKDDQLTNKIEKDSAEEFWKQWLEIINTTKNKEGEPVSESTKKQKRQAMNLVKEFFKEKGLKPTFETLNIKFYHSFDAWLSARGLNENSRGNYLKQIKAILREADDRDIPVSQDYRKKSWKIIQKSPESVFLNNIEIRKIFECKKVLPQDHRHRDIFVMACFVGARHSDWAQIKPGNVVQENEKDLLRYKQTKTGKIVHVPIHSAVKAIWTKYPKMPRVITNQKFNEALKRIAKAADLGSCIVNGETVEKWTMVATHTARRSFATNAYLSKELEVYQIMRCTGHKTESAFLKYLKLDGRDYATMAAESKFFTQEWSVLSVAN